MFQAHVLGLLSLLCAWNYSRDLSITSMIRIVAPTSHNTPNNDALSFVRDYCCRSTLLLAINESFIARKSAALFCRAVMCHFSDPWSHHDMSKVKNEHYVPRFYLRHFCAKDESLFFLTKQPKSLSSLRLKTLPTRTTSTTQTGSIKPVERNNSSKSFSIHLKAISQRFCKQLLADLEAGKFQVLGKKRTSKVGDFSHLPIFAYKEKREDFKQIMRTVSKTLIDAQLRSLGKTDVQYEIHTDEASFQASFSAQERNCRRVR